MKKDKKGQKKKTNPHKPWFRDKCLWGLRQRTLAWENGKMEVWGGGVISRERGGKRGMESEGTFIRV